VYGAPAIAAGHRQTASLGSPILVGTGDPAVDIPLLRFVQLFSRRQATIVLGIQPKLVRLVKALERSISIISAAHLPQSHSIQLPFSRLRQSARPEDQTEAYPFLHVPLPAAQTCLQAVAAHAKGRPAVGLFLGGRRATATLSRRIKNIGGIAWVSPGEIGGEGGLCVPWDDYLDQAALLECLDLVVTTDLVTALLSGGIGKEVWWLGNPVSAKRHLSRVGGLFPDLKMVPMSRPADIAGLERSIRSWYNRYYDGILARLPTPGDVVLRSSPALARPGQH
jgi:hypothetical protein